MKVIWTATAVSRLEAIEDFISQDDPAAAVRFVDELIATAETLNATPFRGRILPEMPAGGLRELVHRGYRIVYRPMARRIEILTVFEGHRSLREDEVI